MSLYLSVCIFWTQTMQSLRVRACVCFLRERVGGALGGGALLLERERLERVRVQRATAGPRLRHDVPVCVGQTVAGVVVGGMGVVNLSQREQTTGRETGISLPVLECVRAIRTGQCSCHGFHTHGTGRHHSQCLVFRKVAEMLVGGRCKNLKSYTPRPPIELRTWSAARRQSSQTSRRAGGARHCTANRPASARRESERSDASAVGAESRFSQQ